MGGVDKGLQNFNGMPLALHALLRLQPQVGEVMINANRNLGAYEAFGVPVWPDVLADYAGPLAGFLTGAGALRDALAGHRALRHAAVSAGPGRPPGARPPRSRTPRSRWRRRARKTASAHPARCSA